MKNYFQFHGGTYDSKREKHREVMKRRASYLITSHCLEIPWKESEIKQCPVYSQAKKMGLNGFKLRVRLLFGGGKRPYAPVSLSRGCSCSQASYTHVGHRKHTFFSEHACSVQKDGGIGDASFLFCWKKLALGSGQYCFFFFTWPGQTIEFVLIR